MIREWGGGGEHPVDWDALRILGSVVTARKLLFQP
jgi:hypothetical protein